MKKTILNSLTICTLFFATALNAQVGIGVPAENIHPSAELEVKSSTKGFLPPRMTNAERNSIATPATGLLIYQTDAVANNPAGLYFYDGTAWKNGLGVVGAKGDQGATGAQGLPGAPGATGPAGESGLPSGGTNGQIITNCDGLPTWTTGGICPGKIASLNCAGVSVNGSLINGDIASNVSFVITYSGGNSGSYSAQSISSTSVLGLTANLQTGSFATGNGSLRFTVSGTPTSGGNALFSLTIAGQVCSVSMVVQEKLLTIGIPGPNITDVENNTYKTVTIGTQQWMAENLKVSKYSDGTTIPNITDNTQWSNLTTGAFSYYNNEVANNTKYGKLYNWYAINDNKNVCPKGWHVPTDAEWTVLTDYLGKETVAGGKMKEVGTTNWTSPNAGANNVSLFSALPGGYRDYSTYVGYYNIGYLGEWWSSSELGAGSTSAWGKKLRYDDGVANSFGWGKKMGLSVRCLRD